MSARDSKGRFIVKKGQAVQHLVLGANETIEGLSFNDELRLQAGIPVELDDGLPAEAGGREPAPSFDGGPTGGMTGSGYPRRERTMNEKLRDAIAAARGDS